MLRVGRIDYANCTPLFMQLETSLDLIDAEIVHGVPAELNALLAQGRIDLCISSSIEFCRHAAEYLILPGNCIGSCGAVKSVLLLADRPAEQLGGAQLLVTSESATSVVLLQILLAERWGLSGCTVERSSLPVSEALQQAPGLLLIGDKALQAAAAASAPYCYDLGEEWLRLTGLPFVYALWLLNRTSSQGKEPGVREFCRLLDQARDRIAPDAELLAARSPEAAWIGTTALADYWRHAITYTLDDQHLAGLSCYFTLAAKHGLIPAVPALEFLPS